MFLLIEKCRSDVRLNELQVNYILKNILTEFEKNVDFNHVCMHFSGPTWAIPGELQR